MPMPLAKRVFASTAIAAAYLLARPAEPAVSELLRVAGGIRFAQVPVEAGVRGARTRQVHESLTGISGWISSVGAGAALGDLDGDGLPNDICLVDPRFDSVTVLPAPGTTQRYSPIRLDWPESASRIIAPMGCVPGDVNEDGRLDLLVYFWGRTPVVFLARGSAGQPSYESLEIVPGGERWYSNAATFADVDGDTHPDLIVGNYFPDGARILDVSADGTESMQQSMSRARNGGSKQLLRWRLGADGVPRFEQVLDWIDPALVHGWALAVGAADLDGDLRPELYFANDFGSDVLLHNRSGAGRVRFEPVFGRRGWTTPASKVVGRDSFKGMGVDFGDMNGDGWPDIYVSNITQEYGLEESNLLFMSTGEPQRFQHGVAPYVDRSEPLGLARSGWAWDAKLADFDNDGSLEAVQAIGFVRGEIDRWPELQELAMGNDSLLRNPGHWPHIRAGDDLSGHGSNPFFVRRGGERFYNVASVVGTAQPQISRGIAIADIDGDGRLDYLSANQWEPSRLYRNTSRTTGEFLSLRIVYAPAGSGVSERAGHAPRGSPVVGATVQVIRSDGSKLVAQVDGGNGHSGKRSTDVHLGLGTLPAGSTLRTVISWRSATGVRQTTFQLTPGTHTIWLPRR